MRELAGASSVSSLDIRRLPALATCQERGYASARSAVRLQAAWAQVHEPGDEHGEQVVEARLDLSLMTAGSGLHNPAMLENAIDRHRTKLDALEAAILRGPGVIPPEARRAAARDQDVPGAFAVYVNTIHRYAYRVTDGMVAGLAAAGADDDTVFEISVAAAYGAARARLDAGLRALRATGDDD